MSTFDRLFRSRAASSRRPRDAEADWDRQVHHGTLRSELDEPASLPPAFSSLSSRIADLRAAYDAGGITRVEFAEALSTAKVTHTDGSSWTIGATTGQWYRRISGTSRWEPALPPEVGAHAETAPPQELVVDLLADTEPLGPAAPLPDEPGVVDPEEPWPSVAAAASLFPPPTTAPAVEGGDAGVWESSLRTETTTAGDVWGIISDEAPSRSYGDIDEDDAGFDLPPELLDE